MLLGPQTFPSRRGFGASHTLIPERAPIRQRRAEPGRAPDAEIDVTIYAMMSPCCGITYRPETGVAETIPAMRDAARTLGDLALRAWRRIAPTLTLLLRSVVFLTVIAVLGTLGLHLLVSF